ncbi:MAG TPA: SMP-30/gluconolactonase/LRE family protein [Thermoanaerobaculia bacterium]|jgi:sugar lactone lactonase YvrE
MKRIALVVLLAAACASRPVDPGIARVKGLIAKEPDNAAFYYVLARHYDRTRDRKNVLRMFHRLERFGWTLGVWPDHFRNFRGDADFQRLAARLDAREPAVQRATTAFTFSKERDVRSEGIAYDPVDDRFYFSGGTGSLLRVDRAGAISELAIEPLGEKFERLGLHVDPERRQIWTAAAVFDANAPAEEKGRSVLAVYDLRDGRLLRRIDAGSAEQRSILNDLTRLKDGTVFVTDTERDQLLRLAPGATAFELWADGFRGPNGIVLSADEGTLYVSDFYGIHAVDVATKSRRLLDTARPLNAIDGLALHRGDLIAIQNNLGRPRVLRVDPRSKRVEVLEAKNPLINGAATGVIAGDEFFFIASRSNQAAERPVLKIAL